MYYDGIWYKVLAPVSKIDGISHVYFVLNVKEDDPKPDVSEFQTWVDARIPISDDESVILRVEQYQTGWIDYGIQYVVKGNPMYRADTKHKQPHMDIILPGKKRLKEDLHYGPTYAGFENILQKVLRKAEEYNPHAGIRYWLQPLLLPNPKFLDEAALFIAEFRLKYQLKTTETDIARMILQEVLMTVQSGEFIPYSKFALELLPRWLTAIYRMEAHAGHPIEVESANPSPTISSLPFFLASPPNSRGRISFFRTKPGFIQVIPFGLRTLPFVDYKREQIEGLTQTS